MPQLNNIVSSVPQAVKLLDDEDVAKSGVSLEALQQQLAQKQIFITLPLLKIAYEKYIE